LNDIFGMWRRRSALCLCGIGGLEPEKEEHPTTPQIVEVHQRRLDRLAIRAHAEIFSAVRMVDAYLNAYHVMLIDQ